MRTLLFACLFTLPLVGCLHFTNEPEKVLTTEWRAADDIPEVCRNEVYLFLFNTADPLGYCNLEGTRKYLIDSGFGKIYLAKATHIHDMKAEMVRLSEHRPRAVFCIASYGEGALPAVELAKYAQKQSIPIEFLFLMEPCHTDPLPELAHRVTIVRGQCSNGVPTKPGVEYVHMHDVKKTALPTNSVVLKKLVGEMTLTAMGIPTPPVIIPQPVNLVDPVSPPRPHVVPKPENVPSEWQFLDPYHQRWFQPPPMPQLPTPLPAAPELLPPMG